MFQRTKVGRELAKKRLQSLAPKGTDREYAKTLVDEYQQVFAQHKERLSAMQSLLRFEQIHKHYGISIPCLESLVKHKLIPCQYVNQYGQFLLNRRDVEWFLACARQAKMRRIASLKR